MGCQTPRIDFVAHLLNFDREVYSRAHSPGCYHLFLSVWLANRLPYCPSRIDRLLSFSPLWNLRVPSTHLNNLLAMSLTLWGLSLQ